MENDLTYWNRAHCEINSLVKREKHCCLHA